uniref:Ion_trans domain-containing protein n=1 Tax=Angiostrongylus cantonensis TaxID=6313 RepID=A0A0K0D953_ANGCA
MQFLARIRILEPEDVSSLSVSERLIRRMLSVAYRLAFAVFVSAHLFDFLFSSIWMHGYIWSLNLPIDMDMSDKSAGAIVYHQLEQVWVLFVTKYTVTTGDKYDIKNGSILGAHCETVTSRKFQMKQRFFSSLHEGFYCYLITFLVGLILTVRPLERLPKIPIAMLLSELMALKFLLL